MLTLPPPSRPMPRMQPQAYKTFAVSLPAGTHRVRATCVQIDCPHYLQGWTSRFASDDARVLWVRAESERRFVEAHEPGFVVFRFAPGQRCFRSWSHWRWLERPAVHQVLHGDFRGAVLLRTHTRGEDWVDEFANHQDRLATAQRRG